MRGLVWIVALAACAKQGGVQISVSKGSTATTTVRIFVGAGAPSAGTTITAAGGVVHTGTSWSRDPTAGDDTAKMSGDHVTWLYEPSAGPTRLPIVIAVGFDDTGAVVGAGTVEAVDVPDSGFLTYEIPLVAPTNLSVWDSDPSASPLVDKCVALGPKNKEQMIVSPDDEDCDGFIDGSVKPGMWECQPLVYDAASRGAVPDEFTCFDRSSATAQAQCFAGGPNCMDGTGPSTTGAACPLSKYCAPGPLCLACTSLACSPDTGSTIPHYLCPIALEMNGSEVRVCPQKLQLPPGAGADCTNVRLRNAQQNFQPTLSVDTDTRSVHLAAQLDKCKVTIEPDGGPGTDPNGVDTTPIVALMAIDSVATPYSGFVAPILFTFGDPMDGCTNGPVMCSAVAIGATDRASLCTLVSGVN